MGHFVKGREKDEDRYAKPRAYWVALASRQISVISHCCGARNPDQKPWTDAFLLFEAYFLVIVEPLKTEMSLTFLFIILSVLVLLIAYL
jgi:hypothetical protein